MYRKISEVMTRWQTDSVQEPLMIIGVRQTGKTWQIRQFAEKTYEDSFYVNLEEQPSFQSAFEGDLTPKGILRNLSILAGRVITEKTALIIDEIQVCERAITSLKYFCEANENYRIIAAGSLLGVKINRFTSSFPVGKVRLVYMFPLTFEEFLMACGERLLIDAIRESCKTCVPLPGGIHEKALQLCYDYMIVGGMPRAVLNYIEHDRMIAAFDREIHKQLQLMYLADMTKYVSSSYETTKIMQVYESIPRQLAKENPKFKYSTVRANANRRDFYAPIDWLKAAGMVIQVRNVDIPVKPLAGYEQENIFKLYLSDVGILSSAAGFDPRDILPETDSLFKGAVAENYVVQEFKAVRERLYYYKPSESLEIDLLDENGGSVIPMEIKAGRHKRSRSLAQYIEQHKPQTAIRFSAMNFGYANGIQSVPLYAVFCIAENGIGQI